MNRYPNTRREGDNLRVTMSLTISRTINAALISNPLKTLVSPAGYDPATL